MLLDLLGGPDPLIANHFDNTARWFDRLIAAGRNRLRNNMEGLLYCVAIRFLSLLNLREETSSTGSLGISPI